MPTTTGTDNFNHGSFAVPGGGSYIEVNGTPTKDTTVVQGGTPCSLLLDAGAATENIGKNTPSPGSRGWMGFWWRPSVEPFSGADLCRLWTSGFTSAAGMRWDELGDKLYLYMNGATDLEIGTWTLNTWHWLELIFDVSTTTYVVDAQINGANVASLSGSGSATTVVPIYLGSGGFSGEAAYFADWRYGTATSTTDFLGVPATEKQSYYASRRRSVAARR